MRKLLSLLSLVAFVLLSCSGRPQEQFGEPEQRFCRKEELRVRSQDGKSVIGALRYGQAVTVRCNEKNCTGEWGGKAFKTSSRSLVVGMPPAEVQYARHSVAEDGVPVLEGNQEVTIAEWDPKSAKVRLRDSKRWIATADLRDRPESAEERQERLQFEREAREAERRAVEASRVASIASRREYATQLRTHFLDQSMDVNVRVSGSKADRLTLEFVLFNAVWAHKFQNGDLIGEIRGKGFKRVDLRDGYDYHVYWTFDQ